MLATGAQALWREISNAEERRDSKLRSLEAQIKRYAGPWYDGSPADDEEPDYENHSYEAISAFVPSTVAQKPRVKISTRRPTAQREVAKAIQGHVNRWIRDSHFKDVLEHLAVDFQFRWSVALVSVKPRPEAYESDDPLLTQQVDRISPKDFCWDAMAPEPNKARWMAHRYKVDHADLIRRARADAKLPEDEREGWNVEAVEALTAGMANARVSDAAGSDERDYQLDRQEVELYDIYIAEETNHVEQGRGEQYTQANGFAGTLRTLAVTAAGTPLISGGHVKQLEGDGDDTGVEIRSPRPYFGPPQGPYVIGGAFIVPDKNEPLSPLVVTQAQADNLNAFTASMVRQGLNYCKKIIASGIDKDDAEAINDAKHDHLTVVSNPIDVRSQLQSFETGGITQQHVVIAQWLKDILERVSGQNAALRGEIESGATATAVSEGVEAGKARAQYPQDKFISFAEECLVRVGWFGYYVEQIVEPLGEETTDLIADATQGDDIGTGGAVDPALIGEGTEAWFFGGNFEEGSGGTYADLELEIDLFSMVRTSEATQRRKAEVITAVMLQLVPMMAQFPFVKWREVVDMLGDLENIPDLSDSFDWKALSEATGANTLAPSAPMTTSNAGRIGQQASGFRAEVPNLARFAQTLRPGSSQQAPGLRSGSLNGNTNSGAAGPAQAIGAA